MKIQEFIELIKKDGYLLKGYCYVADEAALLRGNSTCFNLKIDIDRSWVRDIKYSIIIFSNYFDILTYSFNNNYINILDLKNILDDNNLSDILPSLNYYIRQIKLNQLLARQYNNLVK